MPEADTTTTEETTEESTETTTETTTTGSETTTTPPKPETKGGEEAGGTSLTKGQQKSQAPDKYDLKKPENSLLTDADLEKIESHSRDRGLSNEDAQKVVDRDSGLLKAFSEGQQTAHQKKVEGWETSLKADAQIGGEKFEENVKVAQTALQRFGSPELVKFLDDSGFGSHPDVVRMFHKIGSAMRDDQFVEGKPGKGEQSKSTADVLYEGTQIDLSGK